MSEARVIAAGEGEVVGDAPDRRVEILCDDDALHATWTRFGPYRDGADLHVHHRHTDLFYVLAGELTVMLGPKGREVAATAGTLACVPPLVVHGFRNAGAAELRYLNFHAPGEGFADYMRGRTPSFDQAPAPPDGGRPASTAVIGAPPLVADEIAIAVLASEPGGPATSARLRSYYVLEGEPTLTVGDRSLRAPAGSWVTVPAGVAHTISLPATARLLELRTPPRE